MAAFFELVYLYVLNVLIGQLMTFQDTSHSLGVDSGSSEVRLRLGELLVQLGKLTPVIWSVLWLRNRNWGIFWGECLSVWGWFPSPMY